LEELMDELLQKDTIMDKQAVMNKNMQKKVDALNSELEGMKNVNMSTVILVTQRTGGESNMQPGGRYNRRADPRGAKAAMLNGWHDSRREKKRADVRTCGAAAMLTCGELFEWSRGVDACLLGDPLAWRGGG